MPRRARRTRRSRRMRKPERRTRQWTKQAAKKKKKTIRTATKVLLRKVLLHHCWGAGTASDIMSPKFRVREKMCHVVSIM